MLFIHFYALSMKIFTLAKDLAIRASGKWFQM